MLQLGVWQVMHAAERWHTGQTVSALPFLMDQGLCTRLDKATQTPIPIWTNLHIIAQWPRLSFVFSLSLLHKGWHMF
jgi:hypothetical protein